MSPKMWFRLLGLSMLLIVAGFVVPALTQGAKKGKKYALLVGVTEYDSKNFSALNYTANDAEEMEKALKKAGFHSIRVLTNERGAKDGKDMPTTANIRAALKAMLAKKTKDDTVLIGLAGHGVQLEVTDPQEKGESKQFSYFCPKDSSFQGISYKTGRSDQLLLLDDLFDDLGKCDAGHRLALIDACRNNTKVKAAKRRLDVSKATIPDGVGVLFSCGRGQFAFETKALGKGHGVFFYHVIQGLRGEAKNRRGVVTWDGLAGYVKGEVPEFVKEKIGDGARQVPASMGNLEGESVLARIGEDTPKGTITNSIGMKFVLVKKGKFTMGSPKDEKGRGVEEQQHEVEITKDFYLGVHEVTQKQYKEVMGTNPSHFSATGKGKDKVKGLDTDDFPVETVSWEDAQAFLKKLNARAEEKEKGRVYRLPSEAEWEYACRGGASSSSKPFHFEQPSDSLGAGQANFDARYPFGDGKKGDSLSRTNTVGKNGEPNKLGLYDMHGNVTEWCQDGYDANYYANSPVRDPLSLKGSSRVLRGGSWNGNSLYCRAADRDYYASFGFNNHGFRVAVPHE